MVHVSAGETPMASEKSSFNLCHENLLLIVSNHDLWNQPVNRTIHSFAGDWVHCSIRYNFVFPCPMFRPLNERIAMNYLVYHSRKLDISLSFFLIRNAHWLNFVDSRKSQRGVIFISSHDAFFRAIAFSVDQQKFPIVFKINNGWWVHVLLSTVVPHEGSSCWNELK